MRDDLHGASAVITMSFLINDRPVDLAGSHIGIVIQAFINEPFIVAQIQICLRSVVRDKNLTVLDRIHRARVHVQIRIKLLHRHLVAARL